MTFYIIAVGRLRATGLRVACDEYLSRACRYVKVEIREISDRGRKSTDSSRTMRDEGKALLAAVPAKARCVALSQTGTQTGSREFAARIGTWRQEARDVAFVIGGADGLDPTVLDRCGERMSLSSMTLPHEMARLMLLEQIYRATTILKGEPYHKGD